MFINLFITSNKYYIFNHLDKNVQIAVLLSRYKYTMIVKYEYIYQNTRYEVINFYLDNFITNYHDSRLLTNVNMLMM